MIYLRSRHRLSARAGAWTGHLNTPAGMLCLVLISLPAKPCSSSAWSIRAAGDAPHGDLRTACRLPLEQLSLPEAVLEKALSPKQAIRFLSALLTCAMLQNARGAAQAAGRSHGGGSDSRAGPSCHPSKRFCELQCFADSHAACRMPLEQLRLPAAVTEQGLTAEQQAFASSLQDSASYIADCLHRTQRPQRGLFSLPSNYGL